MRGSLTITWTMREPGVAPGVDAQPDNPLARACRNLLEHGQRFRCLTQTFFREGAGTMRWLGIFVETEAGRVLFFPGFAQCYDRIVGQRGNGAGGFDRRLLVDHMSLEADLASCHISSPRSKTHQRVGRTLPVGNDTFLWFGMTASSVEMLRPVRAETVASGHVPSEDARNRLETFQAARQGAPLQIVEMNGLSPWRETLHFGVAVGHRCAPPYRGPALALPEGSPFLRRRSFGGPVALPTRMHSFPLSRRRQIHVISTWLPMALTLGVTFTATAIA